MGFNSLVILNLDAVSQMQAETKKISLTAWQRYNKGNLLGWTSANECQ